MKYFLPPPFGPYGALLAYQNSGIGSFGAKPNSAPPLRIRLIPVMNRLLSLTRNRQE